jgi:hypothetical protein
MLLRKAIAFYENIVFYSAIILTRQAFYGITVIIIIIGKRENVYG